MTVNFISASEKRNDAIYLENQTKETMHTMESPKSKMISAPILSLRFFGGPCKGDIK